jgi:Na+/H+ antiporter NhaD/arsenite permease-like protein
VYARPGERWQAAAGEPDAGLAVAVDTVVLAVFALADSGLLRQATDGLRATGIEPGDPVWLFPVAAVLSNLVSNVPAVMLLLPQAGHPLAGPVLALASTLAGNFLIVGSIANIIVVERAAALGVRIGWREHARVGVSVTLLTLAIAAAWLWLRAG